MVSLPAEIPARDPVFAYIAPSRAAPTSGANVAVLVALALATAMYARVLTAMGVPGLFNFAHFVVIEVLAFVLIVTSQERDCRRIGVFLLPFLGVAALSAIWNGAALFNVVLYFMLMAEPFLLIAAIISRAWSARSIRIFRYFLFGVALSHVVLALIQGIVLGLSEDDVKGLFIGQGAGHHVGGALALTAGIYFLVDRRKRSYAVPVLFFLLCVVAAFVSDSKQMFGAYAAALLLLIPFLDASPRRWFFFAIFAVLTVALAWYLADQFLPAFQIWNRPGEATLGIQAKFAVFPIVLSFYESGLNWLIGLGPGHTIGRVALLLPDHAGLFNTLGATTSPATEAVIKEWETSFFARRSSLWALPTTWVGLWGDVGFAGLGAYAAAWWMIWRKVGRDNLSRYLLLAMFILGGVFVWMEEPGYALFVASLIGLRYQTRRLAGS